MEVEFRESGSWKGFSGEELNANERRSSIDSNCGPPSSARLLASFANDYSLYIKTDLSFQISKVEEFLEESVAKLEEYHSLFEMKESERKAWISHIIPDLTRTGTLLSVTLNQRLDTLSSLILSIQTSLDTLEAQISQAETTLGIPSPTTSSTIRSVFKYFIKAEETGTVESSILSTSKKPACPSYQQLKCHDPLQLDQFFH